MIIDPAQAENCLCLKETHNANFPSVSETPDEAFQEQLVVC